MAIEGDSWHLDKRVPVSIIGVMIFQTAAFIWLIATMNADIRSNTERAVRLEVLADERRIQANQNTLSIAVINANLEGINKKLDSIDRKLDEQ